MIPIEEDKEEDLDDLFENYMKQIHPRYSKLISRRVFLRCLILGSLIRLFFRVIIKCSEGKWKIWFEHPLLGFGVSDRNDLEKYPCISFIRNTNKIQQGQDEQSKWYKKDECLKILKNTKGLVF